MASFILLADPGFCEKRKKQKEKDDPEKLLAKAEALYEQGKNSKALRFYEAAAQASEEDCLACLLGTFRAAFARGRTSDAVLYAGATIDAVRKAPILKEDKEVYIGEITTAFREAFARTGDSDPDLLWGLFYVLAVSEDATEIARLAERHLRSEEEKALICAVDTRPSLGTPQPLAVAQEVNEQLRGLGWDGPYLVSQDIRRPKLRNRAYSAGDGARMTGTVDRLGFLKDVRVVRPPPAEITMEVRDRIRRAHFNPATYQGRRISVCYPFSVTLPGQIQKAQQGGGDENTLSPLYALIRGFDSAEAVLDLVEKAGNQVALEQRAAICAARGWFDELNQGLTALEWPGPFFDTEDVTDPVPLENPPPEYTDKAREAGTEGNVVLSAVISETGSVVHIEPLERLPDGLSGQAVNAVRKWTFEPASRGGKNIPVCREITVEFQLDPSSTD